MGSVEVVQVVSVPINQAEIPSADMPLEWVEILSDEPQSQNLIAIEENTPEKGLEVPELEEEVKIVPPPALVRRGLAFVKTLLDSSPYCERLRKKRPASAITSFLSCEGHPFFEGFATLPNVMKSFHDELLSDDGDIFHECPVVWPAFRMVILTDLFESVQ